MMDLQTLQSQLKLSIQNHQLMVLKMRSDPQNISLQKRLHELQAEIMNLSERQKYVVEQLRKDIEVKQLQQRVILQPNKTLNPNNGNQVLIEFSTQNNNCTILRSAILQQNTSSLLRVPQYQPNNAIVTTTSIMPVSSASSHVVSQKNNSIATNHDLQNPVPKKPSVATSNKSSYSVCSKLEKSDFMAALGLITKSTLSELQNKRTERKRRTTANPHFSYSAMEERRKLIEFNGANNPSNFKRPRGRPKVDVSLLKEQKQHSSQSIDDKKDVNGHSIPNGLGKQIALEINKSKVLNEMIEEGRPSSPDSKIHESKCAKCGGSGELLMCDTCTSVYHLKCLQLQVVPSGLWSCPQCRVGQGASGHYKKEAGQWPSSLAVVRNLIALKSVKTEAKQKLLKRSIELKTEKAQLEERVRQLTDLLSSQVDRHKTLMNSNKQINESISSLTNFIKMLQSSS